jgi:uncharacterized protein (TIGR02118 family)
MDSHNHRSDRHRVMEENTRRRREVLKVIILLSRRPDLSTEAFDQHLRETHVGLVVQMPGLRRLVINSVQPDPSGAPQVWDAIAEDWFDDPEALQAALGSLQGQAVYADAATFLDMSKLQFLVVREDEVLLPTPT